jgi:hypothetical protein
MTLPADLQFDPKVWSDHIMAHFDRLLVWGALAMVDRTLTAAPGTTVNFPYYLALGDAEEPAADEALTVDKMEDDSFSCTVKEIGKAVGIRQAAIYKSADSRDGLFSEAQRQIARVLAEKVDKDLVTEYNTTNNYEQGYTSADAVLANRASAENLLTGKITAFGDKHSQAVALYMHSLCFLDVMQQSSTGFLKADATMPMYGRPNFMGQLLGMDLFVSDACPAATAIGGKKAFEAFIVKPQPIGVMVKQDVAMEADKDILAREFVFAGTQWYGIKSLHAKVAASDKRVARLTFATGQTA